MKSLEAGGTGRGDGLDLGSLGQPVDGFVTPQLRFHPIEGSLLCQTSLENFGGFATMTGQVLELLVKIVIADFDLFLGGNAVNDEFGLDVILGAVLLAAAA